MRGSLIAFAVAMGVLATLPAHADFYASACYFPSGHSPAPPPPIDTKDDMLAWRDIEANLLGLKTAPELMEYLKKEPDFQRLKDIYPDIEAAGVAFGLPPQFLACLYFVESRWDPNAKSGANALGLAQLTPSDGIKEINRFLKAKHSEAPMRRDALELQERWNFLWTSLYKSERVPVFDSKAAHTARGGVSGGAMLARYFGIALGIIGDPDVLLNVDKLTMIAGAYNLGAGGIFKRCKVLKADACIKKLKAAKVYETASHMEKVRRCVSRKPSRG